MARIEADYAKKCRNVSKPKVWLFIDVFSAVFDNYHHPRCTGSDYEAYHVLKILETEL